MSSSSPKSPDLATMSFDEYMEFLLIPYEEVASAFNNFADENLIAQGTCARVYKGQLMQSGQLINVVARNLVNQDLVVKELRASYYFAHKNIVSVLKITPEVDSECENVIILNKHEANGSLNNHLSSSTLTWVQRLKICMGVADALSYLHYGYDEYYSIIHGYVKSSSILLDDNWEPKLSGFGFFCVLNDRHHLYPTTKFNGKSQYMDPAYEQTKGLTLKSDVFSFGVVLFEVLFGREASIPDDDDKWKFAQLARLHYEEKTLDDMIDQDLRKQMDFKSVKIFAKIAYFCLKEQRKQRPYMDHVVKELQRVLESQQKHENQECSAAAALEVTPSNVLKVKNLDHLRIRLNDIELATNKFSEKCCIGSGGYGMVYKAKLDHFDGNTVAIKRISSRVDGQAEQVFLAEIEMLSNCEHQNIVSLLGFCAKGPEMILVYEFVSNGSLDDYLGNTDRITSFTWPQRLQICLDIAHGLNYLHTSTTNKPMIIHRDIKSANILLDDNWVAKIGDFGLSKLNHADQGSTLMTEHIAGTEVYLDPEYLNTGKLKKESDIYSFGVVLFEIMCGRLAYDNIYDNDDEKGLPSVARRCYNGGTLRKIVDPKLREADENIFMLNEGLNQHSFDTFSNIAYQCLSKTQAERPTMRVVIEELEKAFNFDKNSKDNLQISLKDIQLATQNFSDDKCVGEGRYWKQYRGDISHYNANGCNTVVVKRWDSKSSKGHQQFLTELKILFEYKHENIVALVGYCNEMDERIIVHEHASNGSLDKYVKDYSALTWMQRLKICLDIARVLCFLHFGGRNKLDRRNYMVVHRDIKTSSILLDADWQVKVSNFELCSLSEDDQDIEHATDNAHGSPGYVSVDYKHGYLTASSDVYSLGVVLCEMICGRLAWEEGCMDHSESLGPLFKRHFEENLMSKLIPSGIQKQLAVNSLLTFLEVALQCLDDEADSRPLAFAVVMELEKALESQEDHEIWEPKLPRDYKEIIQLSRTPEIYSAVTKKKLYDMFTEGILLGDKLVVSINKNGEINEMISAKSSYKNPRSHKWQRVPLSRFPVVAKMLDISNLKIKASIKAQYLSTDVVYGVHLVFKFCDSRKLSEDPIYVNLKYRLWNETLHSFFATWRDDEWMMIELCRFFNGQEEAVYKFLLESFSKCYCGNGAIYVEGIEFRAIEKVKHEESNILRDIQLVLHSNANMDGIQDLPSDGEEDFRICKTNDNCEKVFLLSQVNGKKHPMLSANDALHNSHDMKFFSLISSTQSRFQEIIELQSQQLFRIKCKIESQMLSPDTDYLCYLVFKLSDRCCGLNCPVKVRDVLHWKNKKPKIIYFRSPSPWNKHEGNSVPEQRKDGWMEVAVWKFNSNNVSRNNYVPMNLKLITYEGTMLGLLVGGLEFRPM